MDEAEPTPPLVFLCVGVALRLSSSPVVWSLPPLLEVLGDTTAPPSFADTTASASVSMAMSDSEVVAFVEPLPSDGGAGGWSSLARLLLRPPLLFVLFGDPSSAAGDSLALRSLALALALALAARVLRDGDGGTVLLWLLPRVALPLSRELGDDGALLVPVVWQDSSPSTRSDNDRLAGSDCEGWCKLLFWLLLIIFDVSYPPMVIVMVTAEVFWRRVRSDVEFMRFEREFSEL